MATLLCLALPIQHPLQYRMYPKQGYARKRVRIPHEVLVPHPEADAQPMPSTLGVDDNLQAHLQNIFGYVRCMLGVATQRLKKQYDQKMTSPQFERGQQYG